MSPSRQFLGRRTVLALVAVLVVALGARLFVLQRQRATERRLDASAASAASDFAAAAQARDLSGSRLVELAPAAAQEQYAAIVKGLGSAVPMVEVTAVRRDGSAGSADLRWTWPFGPDGWTYATQLPLAPVGDGEQWAGRFAATVVHPELEAGAVLTASRTPAKRGDVLGRDGAALVTSTPVVEVGVQPSKATDRAALARRLGELLDVDAVALQQRIQTAAPTAFVPVVTLRRSDYEPLRARLQPLPGTVFRESMLPLARTRAFARSLLGTVGPATAEVVEKSDGRLVAGDVAGLSGLQRDFDARLAGSAATRVERVQGQARTELFAVAPVPGEPVRLTLDPQVQQAADTALAGATGGNGNASLVAVDVASGDVLAVANTPLNGADRATTGRYPPGSTFKTVSTLALLGGGLMPAESVACPRTATVDGRSFRNFEGGSLGAVPFRTAFAQSCNTAFVGLSDRLEPPALPAAGTALGLGVPWQVGVDVFAGDVPVPTTPVEKAAATIGQGRVLVSPAAMAQVAGTLARGSWTPPRLVLEPAPGGAPTTPPPAADAAQVATVRELMRQVVLTGTASALADVPGAPVHAKTGTAEYGTDSPPRTHAWTIGFQGGIAFAVLVEDGSSGGAVAVPVVEAFLRAL
ncbi:MAG: penicillin-binding transpeptidase domain-containing protein [Mycobacteriales bacterium]